MTSSSMHKSRSCFTGSKSSNFRLYQTTATSDLPSQDGQFLRFSDGFENGNRTGNGNGTGNGKCERERGTGAGVGSGSGSGSSSK